MNEFIGFNYSWFSNDRYDCRDKTKKIRSLWQDRWRLVYVCSIGGVAILGLFRSLLSSDRCWGACSAGWNRVTMIVTEPFFERE